jgi:EAL domain-containing protein (putative c-di-GMP-specific phosphodiesterase class I)/CHASE2 domain-containing sensor protein
LRAHVCAVNTRDREHAEPKPWRTLLWIAIVGLIFGAFGIGSMGDDVLRMGRNHLHMHAASKDLIVVKIDDASLREVGRWPWPRRYHAQLIDELTKAGAKRIFFDVLFHEESNPVDDEILAQSLRRSGRVVLAARGTTDIGEVNGTAERPPPIFASHATVGSISAHFDGFNVIRELPFGLSNNGKPIRSYSSLLSGRLGKPDQWFRPDYSIDILSTPTVSAAAILSGNFNADAIRGKDVIVGATSRTLGDNVLVPGVGQMGGVYAHVIGALTLRSGIPIDLGWIPVFAASLVVAAFALLRKVPRFQFRTIGAFFVLFLLGPAVLESRLIYLDVVPGLLVLSLTAAAVSADRFRKRGYVDAVSGLPNLVALKSSRLGRDQALIVARVLNYAEVVAALPAADERHLVEQTVARLSVGARDRTLYQGDDGIFAWFDEPSKPFGHHLEALYALFRTPVRVGAMSIDLAVSFGVEIGSSRSLANRLGSALLAAEQAAHDGLKWKYHDPESLEDASWKLSMLSQLDDAIDRGEVWAAYQPKVDLKTRRIIGAEALARWTHPEKGPIAAAEFVAAAEQHDRIGKLTAFMLDSAIGAAAALNKGSRDFDMSVNLSGRLLGDKALVGRIAILLERHRLDPGLLTLELTETAAIAGSGEALDMLTQLRELGVNISIDDYGTGLSTLDYLKRIPAAEIKIDQTFVRGMIENRSERLMVSSTIALAHSLGRRIVAEGVETREALELLAEMECDIAQGYITGRPMSLESLRRRLASDRRAKVA